MRYAILEREVVRWRAGINKKKKLRWYSYLKQDWGQAGYLHLETKFKEGRAQVTNLRSGTNSLRIETGRRAATSRQKRLPRSERKCLICMGDQVEDEAHFLVHCPEYDRQRQKMFERIEEATKGKITAERLQRMKEDRNQLGGLMRLLIGDRVKLGVSAAVAVFCEREMRRRAGIVKRYLDGGF